MEQIEGRRGELVGRLIELLNHNALGEGVWHELGFYVGMFIGGRELRGVVPDTGKEPLPGTVGEEERQFLELVSRERYFELIHDRLRELVGYGIEEAFLVRSIRDEIRRRLESLADVGAADRSRAETRDELTQMAEDPAAIAGFREQLAKGNQWAEALSDDEIAATLRRMAESKLLLPTSANDAVDRWAALTHWDERAAALLPDAAFKEWHQRRLR